MTVTYDDSRMLELWRQCAGLEPAIAEGSVERFDNLDIDRRLRIAMRSWYLEYLREAPLHKAPVTDLTQYARLSKTSTRGCYRLSMICPVARITEIETAEQGMIAIVDPETPDGRRMAAALENRIYRLGGKATAICGHCSDTAIIYGPDDIDLTPTAVRGVMITDDDVFTFDESVLNEIPALALAAISEI